jgi:hypothetical protein
MTQEFNVTKPNAVEIEVDEIRDKIYETLKKQHRLDYDKVKAAQTG